MKDKTPKTNKMKDKTPKTKAENPVNIPTAFASTTDTVRDGEPNNQTLPQADALKDRFKAGSIPLQTDFADLIDIANIGRQAVGGAEGQAGPANGFNLSSTGRLELKYKADKGISVDEDGVGVKAGHGVAANSDGVNVKLAKGDTYDNGGGGQGTDGTTDGAAGGLYVGVNGLCVDAGDGLQIDGNGVSIKLAEGSGLSADQTNGLRIGNDAWIKIMCDVYNADFYAKEEGVTVFFCNLIYDEVESCVAYVLGRSGSCMSSTLNVTLNENQVWDGVATPGIGGNVAAAATMFTWSGLHAQSGDKLKCEVVRFTTQKSRRSVELTLIPAPK